MRLRCPVLCLSVWTACLGLVINPVRGEVVRDVNWVAIRAGAALASSGSSSSEGGVAAASLGLLAQAIPASSAKNSADPLGFDPFRQAVEIAGQAAIAGQTAQSSAEWIDLALQWQQAADLMAVVPPTDRRYKTAQNRVIFYRRNYKLAQQQAYQRHTASNSTLSPEQQATVPDPTAQSTPANAPATIDQGWQLDPLLWLGFVSLTALGVAIGSLFYARKRSGLVDGRVAPPVRRASAVPSPSQGSLAFRESDGGRVEAIPVPVPSAKRDRNVANPTPTPVRPNPAPIHQGRVSTQTVPLNRTTRLAKVDIVNELIGDLDNFDRMKRRKAIWELSQQGDSRAIQPLIELLMESDSRQRSLVLGALSEIGTRTLKPMTRALVVALQDENVEVRKNAIRDLTRIYDCVAQISHLLRHAMEDPDLEVQETAQWALGQLSRIRTTIGVARFPAPRRATPVPAKRHPQGRSRD